MQLVLVMTVGKRPLNSGLGLVLLSVALQGVSLGDGTATRVGRHMQGPFTEFKTSAFGQPSV